MKKTTGMMKQVGSRVATAAMGMSLAMAATGCIFTTDDGDDNGTELVVEWQFVNIDTPVACPQGDFNVVVYTYPVGAAESAIEGTAYNCSAGNGLSNFVSGQVDVWVELVDSANGSLYARSKTERIDANTIDGVVFSTQLDYGFYQLNWGYFATTEGTMEDLTCAAVEDQFAAFDKSSIFATYTEAGGGSSLWPEVQYDCVVGEAPAVFYTEPMPFAVTQLNVVGVDANDDAVGIGGCISDEDSSLLGFEYGNEIVDAGLLLVSLDPEDEGGGNFCYDNAR